ncbi:MAG: hypothetical protein AB1489_14255 [Acidobacteriota bacterium]
MDMHNLQFLPVIQLVSCTVATVSICLSAVMALRLHKEKQKNLQLVSQVNTKISGMNSELKVVTKQATDLARRTAWLESRVRPGVAAPEPTVEESVAAAAKPSITERRHRVLSLSRRGIDVNTIALMLGVPHGEIELIIGLNKVA